MDQTETYMGDQDEFDLRDAILVLSKGWWLVVLLALLGAAAGWLVYSSREITYSAMSTVLVDPDYLIIKNAYPNYLLQNDQIEEMVKQLLGEEKFSHISGTTLDIDKLDRSVVFIIIQSDDKAVSLEAANVWADCAVKWLKENLEITSEELSIARETVDRNNEALSQYLYANNLESLTWCDLVGLTGNGKCNNQSVYFAPNEPLNIEESQRIELVRLVRQVEETDLVYQTKLAWDIQRTNTINSRLMVSNYASKTESPAGLVKALAIPAGFLAGFFAAVLILGIAHWWGSPRTA